MDKGQALKLAKKYSELVSERFKPQKLFLAVTLIAIVIAGACLLANSVRKEIDPDVPVLTITTPRDLFSPFMSSMFGRFCYSRLYLLIIITGGREHFNC
jgi:fucose permease